MPGEIPLWTPSAERVENAAMTAMCRRLGVPDSAALHDLSVTDMERFWTELWDFCGVVASERGKRVVIEGDRMPGARFFPDARLNFAQNLLRHTGAAPAMIFTREDGQRRTISWNDLHGLVRRCAHALRGAGVRTGDRVAAWMPNVPETYVVMLAAASIGATFTSTSPDFGVQGVLDRFGQIEPVVLVAADGYVYNGRARDCTARLAEIRAGLPSLRRTVLVPFVDADVTAPGTVRWDDFLAGAPPASAAVEAAVDFVQLPFDHPLYILYSSGTTGAPKCIVHRQGGILLQHLKEHRLHCDVRPGDRVFYFTTAGWMMWNWLASALASEATLVLYDGAPSYPSGNVLFDLADAAAVTLFGTSAKWIDAVNKAGLHPAQTHSLETVRTITSTGSPLAHESFDYVYSHVKADVHLASISGGTDICGCFIGGDPTRPVWRGEIQAPALGMAVDVFGDDGRPLPTGEKGELVCTRPFPSMPLGFWNDASGAKYMDAYYSYFPGVWRHGDFVSRTEHGGYVIYGRSDATLNPGGVRIGTAEIYRQVEQFGEIEEAIVIGQEWDDDVRLVLFVRLAAGVELTAELQDAIRRKIRANATPRHVPALILAVGDIPRTKSGKITELAVRDVVHGRVVKNTEALANPDALDEYRGRPELGD